MNESPASPIMSRPNKVLNALGSAVVMFRQTPLRWVNKYYELNTDLFDTVGNGSGILNIGYGSTPADLLEAQSEMCRRTVGSLPRPGRWLDVGCGLGGPACLLARENPEVHVTGINIVRGHLAAANERAQLDPTLRERVDFRYGDACAMPFGDNDCFDGVYAIETAFHYADKAAFACEAFRVLRPGGRFACAEMVLRPQGVRWWERPLVTLSHRAIASPQLLTGAQWIETLERAGFSDVQLQDITVQSFGLLGLWADQLGKCRAELATRYPRILLDSLGLGLRYLKARVNDPFLAYVLLTASKRTGDT